MHAHQLIGLKPTLGAKRKSPLDIKPMIILAHERVSADRLRSLVLPEQSGHKARLLSLLNTLTECTWCNHIIARIKHPIHRAIARKGAAVFNGLDRKAACHMVHG